MPKWVVSRGMAPVGPNATLISGDPVAALRALKADHAGEIDIGGPQLAQSLSGSGLIDAYRLYLHPVVLGGGTPFFAGARPALRLRACETISGDVVRLTSTPG